MFKSGLNLLIILMTAFINLAYAADENSAAISISRYYKATCEQYTGTWQGFMTDPSDLFDEDGVWSMTLSLYYKDGYIIGRTLSGIGAKGIPIKIWAQCENGVLKNIFFGDRDQCGAFSQQGLLASKDVLVLQRHWEGSMSETNLLLFLQRKNNDYPYPLPQSDNEMKIEPMKSCH